MIPPWKAGLYIALAVFPAAWAVHTIFTPAAVDAASMAAAELLAGIKEVLL